MSDAIGAQGTTIQIGSTTIDEVLSWSDLGVSADTAEVTHLGSPNNFEEHIKTIKRGGEVSLECNYEASEFEAIQAMVLADTATSLIITTPESTPVVYTTPVHVIWNKMNGSMGDKIAATITLQILGAPVIT